MYDEVLLLRTALRMRLFFSQNVRQSLFARSVPCFVRKVARNVFVDKLDIDGKDWVAMLRCANLGGAICAAV